MIYDYKCYECNRITESNQPSFMEFIDCPYCGKPAIKKFHATANVHIPSYFHTSKSDIFTHEEWQDLKKDPNVERAK